MPKRRKVRGALERFWSKVEKTSDCWLWKAAISSTGYGVFRVSDPDRLLYAHRFSYELSKGAIPSGFCLFSGNNVYYRPDNGAWQCLLCKPLQFKAWYDKNRRRG